MVDSTVNFGPSPDNNQTVNIDAGTPQVSPDVARLRANKAAFGLANYLPDYNKDAWYTTILSGQENQGRQMAAAAVNYADLQQRVQQLKTIGQIPLPDLSNPDSVIEKQYAQRFVAPFVKPNGFQASSLYGDANKQNPEAVAKVAQNVADQGSVIQQVKTAVENNPILISGANEGNTFASPSYAAQWTANVLKSGHPLGKDLPKFLAGFAGVIAAGTVNWLPSLFSMAQKKWQGKLTPEEEIEFGVNASLLHIGSGAEFSRPEIAEHHLEVGEKVDKSSEVAEAGRQVIEGMVAEAPGRPVETVLNAVHGDLKESAVQQVVHDVNEGSSPKSEHDQAIRSLTSNFRLDIKDIENNPGTYGQDMVNRIRDANQNFVENLSDKMTNVMKVNRTPQAIAQEDVVRGEADRIKGTYRGLGNAILDIMFDPVKDYNKLGNVYFTRTKIGTFDGELFTTRRQAELFAELHGIHVKQEPMSNLPVGGMNRGPLDYDTFTEFRTAAGNVGLKSKDLRNMGLGNSIQWAEAKKRLTAPEDTGASIKNQGSGYYIEKRTPFNEHSEALLGDPNKGLGSTEDTRSPRSWWNAIWTGRASSPPMSMSRAEMANRRITAHTPSVLKEVASPEWDTINRIHKDSWSKFNQLLDYGRDLYDENGDKGYFFKSPGEIEDWYSLFFPKAGKPPGDMIEGYFAYKRLYNMDLALRNISSYRFASRLGTELHQWTIRDAENNKVESGFIQGIKRSTIPSGDHSVLILGKTHGNDQIVSAKKLGTTKLGQTIADDVFSGKAHVVELWDPARKELGKISPRANGSMVRYVVSYTAPETKPLDIGQMVPRRGGGHFDYDFGFATAQPRVEYDPITQKHNYVGDRIITLHNNPGEAKDFANRMDTVRQYRQAGMFDEAKQVARDTLHMGDEQFNQWFGPREMPNGGRLEPYLSDEHTIRHVRRGRSTIDYDNALRDKHGSSFRDATTSGSAASQFKVQYTKERDAEQVFSARNKGTWAEPLWEYEPAKLLNPLPVLGRAINRVANSQVGDDMKIAAIMHWLKEAEPHLDYGPNTHAIIHSTPWRIFNGDVKWRSTEENADIIRQLEGNRQKIKTFSGAFNPNERYMHNKATQLAISLYGKWGPKSSIAPTWLLPTLSDPWTIARSLAVHPILGMFKPSAFGMQLSTFSNVVGIAGPKHAGAGFVGALLHEFTRANDHPNFIKHLSKMGEQFGFGPGEVKEAWEQFIDSGFFNVGTEHGYRDDPTSYNPIRNVARTTLEWGMTPFQEGAQFVRAASWFTAYHEYRYGGGGKFYSKESLPGMGHNMPPEPIEESSGTKWKGYKGPITREGWEQILNRAGTLDHNMSRASTAPYQQGPGSIPFMFWAYKLRVTELMLSKQLTTAEKIRLFATSTLMYGGIYGGAGLLGLPVGDYVRTGLLSGNWDVPLSQELLGQPINLFHTTPYVTGHNFWLSAAIEGLPATFIAWLTGALDSNKSILQNLVDLNKTSFGDALKNGNHYNIGEYFGNQSLVEDMMRDHTIMQMVLGAPGSFLGNAYKTGHKLGWDFWNWAVNHDKGTTLNDLLEAVRSINAINVAYQVITAIATHNWMTRTNTVMQSNVSAANAIFMGGSGLHDQGALDNYDRRRILTLAAEARNSGEKKATEEIHFMLDAQKNNDPDAAEAHRIKANSYLRAVEYPEEKFGNFFERARKSYEVDVPEAIATKFFDPKRYPKGVSDEQLKDAADAYYEEQHHKVWGTSPDEKEMNKQLDKEQRKLLRRSEKTSASQEDESKAWAEPKLPRSHHKKKE